MAIVYIPIRVVSLQMAANPGNAYWKKITMASSGYEYQVPAMKTDVDSHVYGTVLIPNNIKTVAAGGMTPEVRVRWLTTATSGNARLQLSFNATAIGGNINDLGFNAETLQNQGAGSGARQILEFIEDLTMAPPNGGNPDENSVELFLDFYRNGANAGDTMNADLEILNWYYVCTI